MISTDNQDVLIRIPVEKVKVRFGGVERELLQLAQGFSFAEYGDGNVFPISCPFEEWILSTIVNSGPVPAGDKGQRLYIQFEAAGASTNDGQGLAGTDVNNITSGL